MKKFEENGLTAKVTDKLVRWEIPIKNLVFAFNNSPDNYNKDGNEFAKIKRGMKKDFAEYVAKNLIAEKDQNDGSSYIEKAIYKTFIDLFEGYEFGDFVKWTDEDY